MLLQVVVNGRSFDISLLKSQIYQVVFFKKNRAKQLPWQDIFIKAAELLL